MSRSRPVRCHELKTWPRSYAEILLGRKRFELRYNDRDFHVDDLLELREWEPGGGRYTGRSLLARVVYMLESGDLADGALHRDYVAMTIDVVESPSRP